MPSQAICQLSPAGITTPIDDNSPGVVSPRQTVSSATTSSTEAGDEHQLLTPYHTIYAKCEAPSTADIFRDRRHRSLEATFSNVTRLVTMLLPQIQQRLEARLHTDLEQLWAEVHRCARGRLQLGQYDMADLFDHFEAKKNARQAQYEHDQHAMQDIYSNLDRWHASFNLYERLEYCSRTYLLVLTQISRGEQIDRGEPL